MGDLDTGYNINSSECSVCQKSCDKVEDMLVLKCMHIFHVSCVD